MDTLITRIANYEEISEFLLENNISQNNCDVSSNHIFENKKEIGVGGFNKIYSINIKDYDKKFIIREPKHSDDRFTYIACLNDQHSFLFSKLVSNNLIPNYPLVINSYICNDDYSMYKPISLQEYATMGDISKYLHSKNNYRPLKRCVLQTLLTLVHMDKILKLSHNDIKPENILMTEIKTSSIHYTLDDVYINFDGIKYLALVSDFDMVTSNTDYLTYAYIFDQYVSKVILHTYYRYDDKDTNIDLISINAQGMKSLLTIKILDIPEFMKKYKHYYVEFSIDNNYDNEQIKQIKLIYRKITHSQSLLHRNIAQFLLMCTNFKNNSYEIEFLTDYVINNIDLSTCIKTHFGDVVSFSDSYDGTGLLYNLNTKIDFAKMSSVLFNTHKHIFTCALNNTKYRLSNTNIFIDELYGLHRFKIKKTVTSEELEKYIATYSDTLNVSENIRNILFNFLIQFNKDLQEQGFDSRNSDLLTIFKMIDFYTSHTIYKNDYKSVCFIVFYMLTYIDLNTISTQLDINKKQVFDIMENILEILIKHH